MHEEAHPSLLHALLKRIEGSDRFSTSARHCSASVHRAASPPTA